MLREPLPLAYLAAGEPEYPAGAAFNMSGKSAKQGARKATGTDQASGWSEGRSRAAKTRMNVLPQSKSATPTARDLLKAATNFVLDYDRVQALDRLREILLTIDPAAIAGELQSDAGLRTPYDWPILETLYSRVGKLLNDNWCWPFGPRKMADQIAYLEPALQRLRIEGASVLEFGAGGYAPEVLSAFFYLNGARSCSSIEPLPVKDAGAACRALHDALMRMLMRPDLWRKSSIDINEFVARAARFDFAALSNSDMESALRNVPIRHEIALLEETNLSGFDFAFSIAVLEHVTDLSGAFSALNASISPGALMCHVIDFSDHAFHAGTCPHRWGYLTQGGGDGHGINRVRLSAMVEKLEAHGFETLEIRRVSAPLPVDVTESLLPQYRLSSKEDLETYLATIVSRRRAR
jgi:hypothetical protein